MFPESGINTGKPHAKSIVSQTGRIRKARSFAGNHDQGKR